MGFVRLLCFCLSIALWTSAGLAQPTGDAEFCVQTFNTYGPAYAPLLETRTEAFVRQVKERGLCNVLQMQEVWRESHQEDLAQLMGHNFTGHEILFADHDRSDSYTTGLASLVRGTIQGHVSQVYKANHSGMMDWFRKQLGVKKAFSAFYADFPDKPELDQVVFYNTHLHHSSRAIRLAQLLELATELLSPDSFNAPLILTGDFNFKPGSIEWQLLTKVFGLSDSYQDVAESEACTYCSDNELSWDNNDRRIDYIFYRSSFSVDIIPSSSEVILRSYQGQPLSDHYGVQSRFYLAWRSPQDRVVPAAASGANYIEPLRVLAQVKRILAESPNRPTRAQADNVEKLMQRLELAQSEDPLVRWWQSRSLPPHATDSLVSAQ